MCPWSLLTQNQWVGRPHSIYDGDMLYGAWTSSSVMQTGRAPLSTTAATTYACTDSNLAGRVHCHCEERFVQSCCRIVSILWWNHLGPLMLTSSMLGKRISKTKEKGGTEIIACPPILAQPGSSSSPNLLLTHCADRGQEVWRTDPQFFSSLFHRQIPSWVISLNIDIGLADSTLDAAEEEEAIVVPKPGV